MASGDCDIPSSSITLTSLPQRFGKPPRGVRVRFCPTPVSTSTSKTKRKRSNQSYQIHICMLYQSLASCPSMILYIRLFVGDSFWDATDIPKIYHQVLLKYTTCKNGLIPTNFMGHFTIVWMLRQLSTRPWHLVLESNWICKPCWRCKLRHCHCFLNTSTLGTVMKCSIDVFSNCQEDPGSFANQCETTPTYPNGCKKFITSRKECPVQMLQEFRIKL